MCTKEIIEMDFPGGAVDKNLPANARDMGSIPGPGRFHMPRGHRACAAQLLSLPAQEKPLPREARAPQLEKSPCPPQLEKAQAQQQRSYIAKKKKKALKKRNIADLQCCVNFFCTAVIKLYIHIYIFFFKYSFPLWFITGY